MSEPNPFTKPWHGVPREAIEWNPTVVPERCVGCGLCVTSCGRSVYQFDYANNVAVVANSLNCMVGCSTCATVCPREAIEFPSAGYIQQLIRERKIIRQSKELLCANPE
jgi:CDP-4-dehydro-6-deoxyglucose reductase